MKSRADKTFGYRWRRGVLFILIGAVPVFLADAAVRLFERYGRTGEGTQWWASAGESAVLLFIAIFGPVVAYQQAHYRVTEEEASNTIPQTDRPVA